MSAVEMLRQRFVLGPGLKAVKAEEGTTFAGNWNCGKNQDQAGREDGKDSDKADRTTAITTGLQTNKER
mgnify:FL=1